MIEALILLRERLWKTNGDWWLDNTAYYFANKDKPDFDKDEYVRRLECEKAIDKAIADIDKVIEVLRSVGDN